MPSETTLDQLRAEAERAGLNLDEEELKKLLPGVNRSRRQIAELREIVSGGDEPADIFLAGGNRE